MPEGHTVHRLARDHTKWLAGQRLKITSPQGRFQEGARSLSGKILKSVEAHGKHLYYSFASDQLLHVHLGLYGKFRLHTSPPPEPRGAVRVRFIGKAFAIDLNGPNQCEILTIQQVIDSKARLGEDPLFLLHIHPSRPCNSLRRSDFDTLWATAVRLLEVGVKFNRIITVDREATDKPLSKLNAEERLCIYKKVFCPRRGSKPESWLLGNRKMYACSKCQF